MLCPDASSEIFRETILDDVGTFFPTFEKSSDDFENNFICEETSGSVKDVIKTSNIKGDNYNSANSSEKIHECLLKKCTKSLHMCDNVASIACDVDEMCSNAAFTIDIVKRKKEEKLKLVEHLLKVSSEMNPKYLCANLLCEIHGTDFMKFVNLKKDSSINTLFSSLELNNYVKLSIDNINLDATSVPLLGEALDNGLLRSKPITVCVELKPKQGFLEKTSGNLKLCCFCLKQFVKVCSAFQ